MFRVEFALAVDVVNEEPGLADEVIVVFVESLRRIGEYVIGCETLFLRTSGGIRHKRIPFILVTKGVIVRPQPSRKKSPTPPQDCLDHIGF